MNRFTMMCLCASITCSAELRSIRWKPTKRDAVSAPSSIWISSQNEKVNNRLEISNTAQRRLRHLLVTNWCKRACSFKASKSALFIRFIECHSLASGVKSAGFCGSVPNMTLMRSNMVAMIKPPAGQPQGRRAPPQGVVNEVSVGAVSFQTPFHSCRSSTTMAVGSTGQIISQTPQPTHCSSTTGR